MEDLSKSINAVTEKTLEGMENATPEELEAKTKAIKNLVDAQATIEQTKIARKSMWHSFWTTVFGIGVPLVAYCGLHLIDLGHEQENGIMMETTKNLSRALIPKQKNF